MVEVGHLGKVIALPLWSGCLSVSASSLGLSQCCPGLTLSSPLLSVSLGLSLRPPPGPPVPARPPAGLPSPSFTAAAPEGCTSGGGGGSGDRGRKETQTELVVQVEVEGRANDGFVRVELRPVLAGYLQIVEVLFSESLISFVPFLEPGISRSQSLES